MEWIQALIDFILNIDDHLIMIVGDYGLWTYVILFAIIFAETGLVVTPILPGDSLLFAAGAIAAAGALNALGLIGLLIVAAILGDTVNYSVGSYVGTKVFKEDSRIFKLDYLRKTEAFFEKYGGKTIVIARFVPIVRTYAPFVAGASTMHYGKFILYNVIGGVIWVSIFILLGYLFGNLPFVKDHFSLVALGIIALSLVPVIVELVRARTNRKNTDATTE